MATELTSLSASSYPRIPFGRPLRQAVRGRGQQQQVRGGRQRHEYETSNRSPENPDHEQLVRPAARLCTYLSFLIPSFQLSLPTVNTVQTKLAPCVHFSLGQQRPVATLEKAGLTMLNCVAVCQDEMSATETAATTPSTSSPPTSRTAASGPALAFRGFPPSPWVFPRPSSLPFQSLGKSGCKTFLSPFLSLQTPGNVECMYQEMRPFSLPDGELEQHTSGR